MIPRLLYRRRRFEKDATVPGRKPDLHSRLGETAVQVVVHHTHRLHEGVDDRASDKAISLALSSSLLPQTLIALAKSIVLMEI